MNTPKKITSNVIPMKNQNDLGKEWTKGKDVEGIMVELCQL